MIIYIHDHIDGPNAEEITGKKFYLAYKTAKCYRAWGLMDYVVYCGF